MSTAGLGRQKAAPTKLVEVMRVDTLCIRAFWDDEFMKQMRNCKHIRPERARVRFNIKTLT